MESESKKKERRKLRVWNEEIANAIKEKHQIYLIHLQEHTEELREAYTESRNKAIIRKNQNDS